MPPTDAPEWQERHEHTEEQDQAHHRDHAPDIAIEGIEEQAAKRPPTDSPDRDIGDGRGLHHEGDEMCEEKRDDTDEEPRSQQCRAPSPEDIPLFEIRACGIDHEYRETEAAEEEPECEIPPPSDEDGEERRVSTRRDGRHRTGRCRIGECADWLRSNGRGRAETGREGEGVVAFGEMSVRSDRLPCDGVETGG